MSEKEPTSMRLTIEVKRLMKALAKRLGITQVGVVEIAVRRLADSEKADNKDGK